MPTYEYACDSCGYEFEREQRITDSPVKICPKCGEAKARRMIGGGNFILKGGGWESDLYSGPSNRTEKAKGSTEKTTAETAAATPSESKSTDKSGKKEAKESKPASSKATGSDK